MSVLRFFTLGLFTPRTSQCITTNLNLQRKSIFRSTLLRGENKSTIIEKWSKYLDDLIKDYADVLKETIENGRKSPSKTIILFSSLGFILMCSKTNPDSLNYRDNVISCSNSVLLVPKAIRNRSVEDFLTTIETCYNFGVLHRLNFGVLSIIWMDNFGEDLGIFKTQCSYLKPGYLSVFNRVVDIGIFGKWWRLGMIMKQYDVNVEEWQHESK